MGWSRELDLFLLEKDLQSTEKRCPNLAQDLRTRMWLAWGLRQSDGRRAQSLASQALLQLQSTTELSPDELCHARGRMRLVLAEVALHLMRLTEAQDLMDQARADFESLGDQLGLADLHWLTHYLHGDRGESGAMRDDLFAAMDAAELAGDAARTMIFKATLARADLFVDQELARLTWSEQFPYEVKDLNGAAAAAVADFRGLECGMASNYAGAIPFFVTAFERAQEAGQIRRAIAVASNLGYTYTSMSDHRSAVGWLKKGLEIARRVRWPGAIGLCLAQTGEAQRRVGQIEAARAMLRECLQIMKDWPVSRTALLGLHYLGLTELDLGHYAEALEHFDRLARVLAGAPSEDLGCEAELGRARALLYLDRLDEARQVAQQGIALAAAKQQRSVLVDMHWTMAEVERRSGASPAQVIACFHQALEQAKLMKGYRPPPKLLDEAARAHALAGEHEQAYAMSTWAGEVRQQTFTEETSRRATALQARQQIEKERAEREQARRQSGAENERLLALARMQTALVGLAALAADVQACASAAQLAEILRGHLPALLRASAWIVYGLPPAAAAGGDRPCRVLLEDGAEAPLALLRELESGLVSQSWRFDQELLWPADETRAHAVMALPLMQSAQRSGVLALAAAAGVALGETERAVLHCIGAHLAPLLCHLHSQEGSQGEPRHVLVARD